MHFQVKNTLKNNHYHNTKHALNQLNHLKSISFLNKNQELH
jgi:hypothetical protein